RAGDEGALLADRVGVPVEQRSTRTERAPDDVDRALEAIGRSLRKAAPVREQRGRVELVDVGVEAVRLQAFGPAARLDEAADLVECADPARRVVVRKLASARKPDRTVERDLGRQLRVCVVTLVVPRFPEAGVLVPPAGGEPVEHVDDELAATCVESIPLVDVSPGGVNEGAVAAE